VRDVKEINEREMREIESNRRLEKVTRNRNDRINDLSLLQEKTES